MLARYFSKFVTDILPSVVATVIGAWIVTHYINPKSSTDQPKAEASAPAAKAPLNGASGMSPRAVESVAVKPTGDEPAEPKRPAREKAATQPQPSKETTKESSREATRDAKAAPQQPVSTTPSRTEERKDATDLARAALDRLRQEAPEPARAAVSPVLAPPVLAAPAAPVVPTPASAPAPAVMAAPAPTALQNAPALPPPVVITAPRDVRPVFDNASRLVPPADIPGNPDGMASTAVPERSGDNPSLFGGLKSAAKSLVETVIPR